MAAHTLPGGFTGSLRFEVIMARRVDLIELGHAAAIVARGGLRLLGRTLSGLAVWILPIVVVVLTGSALTGRFNFHQGGAVRPDRDQADGVGDQPLMVVNLYYPREYIRVVRQADERGHDVLAGFEALEAAWKAAVPSGPLVLELVNAGQSRRLTGRDSAPSLRIKVAIDQANFAELCPFLKDIRTVILEGDGSGAAA